MVLPRPHVLRSELDLPALAYVTRLMNDQKHKRQASLPPLILPLGANMSLLGYEEGLDDLRGLRLAQVVVDPACAMTREDGKGRGRGRGKGLSEGLEQAEPGPFKRAGVENTNRTISE